MWARISSTDHGKCHFSEHIFSKKYILEVFYFQDTLVAQVFHVEFMVSKAKPLLESIT